MAVKSSKHENVLPLTLVLNGGVNYAQSPANIGENELRGANNFIYDASTDTIITRPGTSCQTAAKCDSTNPILAIYEYRKSSSVTYTVAACNGNLYYLSGASLNAWTLIGALSDTTTVPDFLTFNTKLLIADGTSVIRTWDGTTYGMIATAPKATALHTIKNRVVANASDEPDSVYLSGPEDETDWNTTTGGALGLKAGFGDNLAVNDFGVFGDDLIIFKKGGAQKKICRVNVSDATPANWYVQDLSSNNGAQNNQSVAEAWNNVFFIDDNGFKSIKGVNEYGDLQTDITGRKVNSVFPSLSDCDFCTYIPGYNTIWFGLGDRVLCYTERVYPDGARIPAFTDLTFKQGRIRSVCQSGDTVYLAGNDGFLYKLDETVATDATSNSTTASFSSVLKTKTFTFGGDGILRKIQLYLRPKIAGSASLNVFTDDETSVALKAITLPGPGTFLYDSTGYLADAAVTLYDSGSTAWVETCRNRVRAIQMTFQLVVTTGRVGVEWVRAEIALVEGGE